MEQKILLVAQLIIVILTLIQSWLNKKTLDEMEASRTQSVYPLLFSELGAEIKGVFDGETSYLFDLKVSLDTSVDNENMVELTPFDVTIKNIGRGPAYNIIVKEINNYPVKQSDDSIRIIKENEFKQIQFVLRLTTKDFLKKMNTMKITYEDMYNNRYEQKFDFEVDEAFYKVKRFLFNKPNKK